MTRPGAYESTAHDIPAVRKAPALADSFQWDSTLEHAACGRTPPDRQCVLRPSAPRDAAAAGINCTLDMTEGP